MVKLSKNREKISTNLDLSKTYNPIDAIKILKDNSVHYDEIGIVTKNEIIIDKEPILYIDDLIESNKNWLELYMDK